MNKNEMKAGKYYFLETGEEKSLVYCYNVKEFDDELCVGFNAADGGCIMPVFDIKAKTKISELKFNYAE